MQNEENAQFFTKPRPNDRGGLLLAQMRGKHQ